MASLTEFLLARIAEDEAVARGSAVDDLAPGEPLEYELRDERQFETLCIPARRVLAECEAKRQIAESAEPAGPRNDFSRGWDVGASFAVQYLAQVYVDHPDFREEWRP